MTPAINHLKKSKIEFKVHHFDHDPNITSYGKEAAAALKIDEERVFKTLLVKDLIKNEFYVFMLPVNSMLNLKKAAKQAKIKKAEMAKHDDAKKVTGYIVGGISPIAQKKRLKTFLDISALDHKTIFVSAGKRGLDIEISPNDLSKVTNAKICEIRL